MGYGRSIEDASGNWGQQTFAYDAVGNRLSKSEPSGLTQYGYGVNNHRLDNQTGAVNRTYQYDAAGHLLNEGALGFVYDNSGRLLGAHLSGTPISVYLHNALDQRIAKLSVNGPSVFVYDEAGRMIGDYSESRLTETIWLNDIPVAVLKSHSNGSLALAGYIHSDHLGTPRKITDPSSNNVIWQWQGAPFGETAANDDPDGDGNHLTFHLRFPGQYYDTETGTHYNVHRNYDPALGRYIQSDPIGLAGGINTYNYVRNNPVNRIDPSGLLDVYGYQSRGGGSGWQTQYQLTFDPLSDNLQKAIRLPAWLKYTLKVIPQIDTKPVGPLHPIKDFLQCGKLDAKLKNDYQDIYGD